MPSPRRNGKRGKDKPVVIVFPGNPIGYLGGMALSSEEERCLKFANEKEARAWVINQQMMVDQYDAHLCIDILRQIYKGKKVIRCDSGFTYGPNSIWAGRPRIYDYGIDYYDHGEEISRTTLPRTTLQGAESASASEPAISSAHAGPRGIFDDLERTVDSVYSQHLARYEQARHTPSPGITIDRDQQQRVTIDRDLYERISRELSGTMPRPSDLFESLGVLPSASESAPTVDEREQPRHAAPTASTANATGNAVSAVSEERSRLEQRHIAEVLEQGRDPMSRHEERYEDCTETCSGPGCG